jgi:hypothetical protein
MKTFVFTAIILVFCSATAHAQRDAGAKARGDFSFYARSGYSHMNAAHAHASHYHGYLGQASVVSPRIATLSDSTVSHHLDLAQQHSAASPGTCWQDAGFTGAGNAGAASPGHQARRRKTDGGTTEVTRSFQP